MTGTRDWPSGGLRHDCTRPILILLLLAQTRARSLSASRLRHRRLGNQRPGHTSSRLRRVPTEKKKGRREKRRNKPGGIERNQSRLNRSDRQTETHKRKSFSRLSLFNPPIKLEKSQRTLALSANHQMIWKSKHPMSFETNREKKNGKRMKRRPGLSLFILMLLRKYNPVWTRFSSKHAGLNHHTERSSCFFFISRSLLVDHNQKQRESARTKPDDLLQQQFSRRKDKKFFQMGMQSVSMSEHKEKNKNCVFSHVLVQESWTHCPASLLFKK